MTTIPLESIIASAMLVTMIAATVWAVIAQ